MYEISEAVIKFSKKSKSYSKYRQKYNKTNY